MAVIHSETKIKFSIPQSAQVNLKVYDAAGKEVTVLVNSELRAGEYQYDWNAVNLPSGVYFYILKAGEFSQTKKMILVK